MKFSVRVPASSANLGPGFDSLAIALSRYLTIDVETGEGSRRNEQQDDLGDGEDMVLQAMEHFSRSTGAVLSPARIETRSCIPVARGLGSSAAALIGGMLVANYLSGDTAPRSRLLALAMELEGHADNLAAALNGGAVLAVPVDGSQKTVHLPVNCALQAAVFVPATASLTVDARAAIPTSVPRDDAVFNASRCALLVHAFASGKPRLLATAMEDRLHQPYRSLLYPHLNATIEAAIRAGAYGASLSGSGPSVLAFVPHELADGVAREMKEAAEKAGVMGNSLVLDIEKRGARVIKNLASHE